MEGLFRLSQRLISINRREYVRYFLKTHPLKSRFSILVGQRGIGKTTAMIQHMLSSFGGDAYTEKALYVPTDHFLIADRSLYEIAEDFHNLGGEMICFDEIHKYQNWAVELKSIYDTFPKLTIICSGSSALEIYKGSRDLSRRAVVHKMFGMSFREFLEMTQSIFVESVTLKDVLSHHQGIARAAIKTVESGGGKILALFKEYLRRGYYPYFSEYEDKQLFYLTLEQNVHTTLESDLIAIYPSLTGASVQRIKKLLSVIAASVPFTPDLKQLKNMLGIGDERTLKTYLKYLEDAGVILALSGSGRGLRQLEKPDKLYLENTNLAHAISSRPSDVGNIRETFFFNALRVGHHVSSPARGDFLVGDKYTFEVGGKNKGFEQIREIENSFLALDDIEVGAGRQIPLWLFGLLY